MLGNTYHIRAALPAVHQRHINHNKAHAEKSNKILD